MGIDFDIKNTPPAAAEINATRERLLETKALLRRRNYQFLAGTVIALILLFILLFTVAIPSVRTPQANPTIVTILSLYTPYAILLVFAVSNTFHVRKVELPRKEIDRALSALAELSAEDLSALDKERHGDPAVADYWAQVVAQGRALLRGEADAMTRWLEARETSSV